MPRFSEMMGSGYKPLPVFYHDTPCKAAPSWSDPSQHAYHSPVASRPVPMASVQAENIVDLVEKVDAVNA